MWYNSLFQNPGLLTPLLFTSSFHQAPELGWSWFSAFSSKIFSVLRTNWELLNSLSLWLNLEQGRFQASRLKSALENVLPFKDGLLLSPPLIHSCTCLLYTLQCVSSGFRFTVFPLLRLFSSFKIYWENLTTLQCLTNGSP